MFCLLSPGGKHPFSLVPFPVAVLCSSQTLARRPTPFGQAFSFPLFPSRYFPCRGRPEEFRVSVLPSTASRAAGKLGRPRLLCFSQSTHSPELSHPLPTRAARAQRKFGERRDKKRQSTLATNEPASRGCCFFVPKGLPEWIRAAGRPFCCVIRVNGAAEIFWQSSFSFYLFPNEWPKKYGAHGEIICHYQRGRCRPSFSAAPKKR